MYGAVPTAPSYTYDSMNQITKILDAKGNVTSCTYDELGRRLTITNPMGVKNYICQATSRK
jgi:YD repeat-containing protein